MLPQTILEGLGLGALLVLVCTIGIHKGAVGMAHLYDSKVQERCVALGLTTKEKIKQNSLRFKLICVPGYLAYMVYLIDDKYLFTGDTLWFGADGGYSFISSLAESNKLAVKSLAALEQKLQSRDLHPLFLTGHTGWTDNFEFAFAHKDKLCSPFKKRVPDPTAPYDAYDESDDTEEVARAGYLQAVGR